MSEYDLKKSIKIGQLYPILIDAEGNIIDGHHRQKADPSWRTETISEIDTEEKLLIARCAANWHRRPISREEKEKWINDLAKLYQEQGYKIKGEPLTIIYKGKPYTNSNQIVAKIMDEIGLSENTVLRHLDGAYKQVTYTERNITPKIPASQRIETELGKDYVERHREEVREEILDEVKAEAVEIAKEELSQDIDFITETIEKAPEIVPNLSKETIERAKKVVKPKKEMGVKEGTVYIVGEYECPQCKKHYLIKCNGKKDWVE